MNIEPGLYLVATPLGNMGDMSTRGREILEAVDVIACEDTREMKKLLSLLGVERGDRNIISVHEHNEFERSGELIEQILSGMSVAYASDAGMPAISDPGALLVDAAHNAGVVVTCIPGATAVTTAVALSGFSSPRFCFVGFFPRSTKDKKELIEYISRSSDTVVFYESPKRLGATLRFLAGELNSEQRIMVCRELTKKFEEIVRGTCSDLADHFAGEVKGECVVVLEGFSSPTDENSESNEAYIARALEILHTAGVSSRDAVDALGGLTQIPKNRLKEMYVALHSG